jgi:DNA-binding GntR family transcriptional regulator
MAKKILETDSAASIGNSDSNIRDLVVSGMEDALLEGKLLQGQIISESQVRVIVQEVIEGNYKKKFPHSEAPIVSRMHVREMLPIFEIAKIINMIEGRWRVNDINENAYEVINESRNHLELFLARKLAEKVAIEGEDKIKNIKDLLQRAEELRDFTGENPKEEYKMFIKMDRDFHYQIAFLSGFEEFANLVRGFYTRKFLYYYASDLKFPENRLRIRAKKQIPSVLDEHNAIAKAIQNGDANKAYKAMEQHFKNSENRLEF